MSVQSSKGSQPPLVSDLALDDTERVSLCEVLDRVLNKGVVVVGEATISVADIDLVYLGLQIVLTSMETARQSLRRAAVELGPCMDIRLENQKEKGSGVA